MPQLKTVLFDFDGTIADTFSVCVDIANKNASKFGFRKIKTDEFEMLRGMTPFELLKEFKIPFYKVPFFIKKVQLELYEGMDKVAIFPGMKKVIESLHKKNYLLGIITSNTEENVRRCLEANNVSAFDFIHNERNIFGKSHTIKNVLKTHTLKPSEVVYVGDEVRDIQASKKSRIKCISVTWGFNTKELLKKSKPTFIVNSPMELLKLLKDTS